MLIEAETIPYDAARLRGERLLILAPHPDDEVIGCGGLVAQHLDERRAVRVVVATDGSEADPSIESRDDYRALRERESRDALALLGNAEIEFLRFPDRALGNAVAMTLREQIARFKPDLICVPSPIEIHPDHLALSRAFCELVQADRALFADAAIARVAFYEVSQPLRPNTLVDITDVATRKYQAIAAHASQMRLRDYVAFARGLNAYRALTLPPETKFAEGYWTMPLAELRTIAFSTLRDRVGAPARVDVARETLPVSVVIRTKDRPALLRDAIDSVRANQYPATIIVVNDGGAKPEVDGVKLVNNERPTGRSEAMNAGVRAATTKHVAFLDDDDLYYAEHLATLTTAAQTAPGSVAWYSDAVSAFIKMGERGTYADRVRLRIFAEDFDPQLLLVDNYIPLPTLLTQRDTFLEAGGFDRAFDLFEDWDFLIRLSQRGTFTHVPRITCEVRHFVGGDSIVLAEPEGSEGFRAAKLQVWKKHDSLITRETFANVLEAQKRRAVTMESSLVEEKGRRSAVENELARLEREKNQLIGEIQALHNSVVERTMYIKELEGVVQVLRGESERAVANASGASAEVERLRELMDDAQSMSRAAYAEIERLQGLLNMIYRSRTWKLHTMVERMRGRS